MPQVWKAPHNVHSKSEVKAKKRNSWKAAIKNLSSSKTKKERGNGSPFLLAVNTKLGSPLTIQ